MEVFVRRMRPFALAPAHDDRWALRVSEVVTDMAKLKEATRRKPWASVILSRTKPGPRRRETGYWPPDPHFHIAARL